MKKHYTADEWQGYVDGSLPEKQRRAMEAHLDHCEECLMMFTAALTPGDSVDFAGEIMSGVADIEQNRQKAARENVITFTPARRRQLMLCYVIAAAAALLLSFSGVLDTLIGGAASSGDAFLSVVNNASQSISETVRDITTRPAKP